jgi:hypothetical protein
VYVPVEDTIRGFDEILQGKHDDLPERAFFLKGTIEDVVKSTGHGKGDEQVSEDEDAEEDQREAEQDAESDEDSGDESDEDSGDESDEDSGDE